MCIAIIFFILKVSGNESVNPIFKGQKVFSPHDIKLKYWELWKMKAIMGILWEQ